MGDAQRINNANAINQGSAVVGYNRVSPATIEKLDNYDGIQVSELVAQSGYVTRYDDYGLRRRTVAIGTWDMDTDGSIEITHGLPPNAWLNTRSIEMVINNDDSTILYDDSDASGDISISGINSTVVTLLRKPSGKFDDAAFDAAVDRGTVTIWYE